MSSPTTLLVEDKREMRLIIRTVLSAMGLRNVVEAEDGEEARLELETLRPQLIISDWNMPRKNGLELLALVRKDPALAKTPFLMLTSENDVLHIKQAMDLGVSDYVVKPFQATVLEEKIRALLKSYLQ